MPEPAMPAFEPVTAAALRADPARSLRLAELACSAQAAFCNLFPAPWSEIVNAVAMQIAAPGFDMEHAFALRDGQDVAIVTGVTMPSLIASQMAAMAALLRLVPGPRKKTFLVRMRAYAAGVEPIRDTGHYVSRLAVAPERQGKGLGRRAMAEYVRQLGSQKAHLHVHRDNAAAIAAYLSLGYVPHSKENYVFPAYTREP